MQRQEPQAHEVPPGAAISRLHGLCVACASLSTLVPTGLDPAHEQAHGATEQEHEERHPDTDHKEGNVSDTICKVTGMATALRCARGTARRGHDTVGRLRRPPPTANHRLRCRSNPARRWRAKFLTRGPSSAGRARPSLGDSRREAGSRHIVPGRLAPLSERGPWPQPRAVPYCSGARRHGKTPSSRSAQLSRRPNQCCH